MKVKKIVLLLIAGLCLTLTFTQCKKCKNEDPRARIINNGLQKASVQIKTSGGNTVNTNNVESGVTSDYATYAPGDVEFTVSAGNKTTVVTSVRMETCFEYDIVIDDNNNITSKPTDRNK